MIIDHTHPEYIELRKKTGKGKYNGCYYYSKEIVDNIIPRITTERDWNTVGKDIAGTERMEKDIRDGRNSLCYMQGRRKGYRVCK